MAGRRVASSSGGNPETHTVSVGAFHREKTNGDSGCATGPSTDTVNMGEECVVWRAVTASRTLHRLTGSPNTVPTLPLKLDARYLSTWSRQCFEHGSHVRHAAFSNLERFHLFDGACNALVLAEQLRNELDGRSRAASHARNSARDPLCLSIKLRGGARVQNCRKLADALLRLLLLRDRGRSKAGDLAMQAVSATQKPQNVLAHTMLISSPTEPILPTFWN